MSHFENCGCGDMTDALTFPEAMALPSEQVEFKPRGGVWGPLHADWVLGNLREGSFRRRAIPERSRVQEMAQAYADNDRSSHVVENAMGVAVREVCNWLRSERIGPRAAMGPHGLESAADAIEREFLVPRVVKS